MRSFATILIAAALALFLCFRAAGRELALPRIPAELRSAPERAAWLAQHFWDNLDFSDSAAVADRDFMGRNFADFMSVMPLADSTAQRLAVETLVSRAAVTDFAANELSLLTEGYLLDRRSPVADDDTYLLFADAMLAARYPRSEAIAYMRRMTASCRPGTEAPDFAYTTRDGSQGRLSLLRGKPVVLLFYSPDCPDCRAEIERLAAQPTEGVVLAVYGGADPDIWHAGSILPPEWIDAIVPDIDELYPLDSLPRTFSIDEDGIIIKN